MKKSPGTLHSIRNFEFLKKKCEHFLTKNDNNYVRKKDKWRLENQTRNLQKTSMKTHITKMHVGGKSESLGGK